MAARNTEEAAQAHLILNLATSFISQLPRERGKECRIQVGGTAARARKILVGPRLQYSGHVVQGILQAEKKMPGGVKFVVEVQMMIELIEAFDRPIQ